MWSRTYTHHTAADPTRLWELLSDVDGWFHCVTGPGYRFDVRLQGADGDGAGETVFLDLSASR